jgi:hypothetical protein
MTRIDFYRDGDILGYSYDVEDSLVGIESAMFTMMQHHGMGNYVAVERGDKKHDRLEDVPRKCRLLHVEGEWLEGV